MSQSVVGIRVYCDEYVCLSVCLSHVRSSYSNTTWPVFMCVLSVAVAPSSSDGVAIRRVLPVLRMTSLSQNPFVTLHFRRISPGGGTSWNLNLSTYTYLIELSECGCAGVKVGYLRLRCGWCDGRWCLRSSSTATCAAFLRTPSATRWR